jgi:formyltetrahydrofolate deformylase
LTAGGPQPGLLRLLLSCPDRPGIVAGVSRFLYEAGANVVRSDQYSTDPSDGTFSLRMEFTLKPARREGLTCLPTCCGAAGAASSTPRS